MEVLSHFISTLVKSKLVELDHGGRNISEDHLAKYPSAQWGTKAWSYRLLLDMTKGWVFHDLPRPARVASRLLSRKHAYSFHEDFSAKVFLYEKLRKNSPSPLLIPETGPCGFDILIAYIAGYRDVVAFDVNSSFVACCRDIWQNVPNVSIFQSPAESFDYAKYPNHLIIRPDWPHFDYGNLGSKMLAYASNEKRRFRPTSSLIETFYSDFQALSRAFSFHKPS